jgi:hypothetical protein
MNLDGLLVGAEGFEGSFPSDRYAVFFVRFNCKTTQFERLVRILRRTLLSQIFSPMDSFPQDFRITSYHSIAPKFVLLSLKVGAKGTATPPRRRGLNALSGSSASEISASFILKATSLGGPIFPPTQLGGGL